MLIKKVFSMSFKFFLFVESPSKVKSITSYLKDSLKDFIVLSTRGHIYTLKKKIYNLPSADMEWQSLPSASKLETTLKSMSFSSSSHVMILTDNDREGEFIGYHILDFLSKVFSYDATKAVRVYFNEISRSTIVNNVKTALSNNSMLDYNLVAAAIARSCIDSVIGFNGSSMVWSYGCKAVGRVQSACLQLLNQREQIIRKFVSEQRFVIKYNSDIFTLVNIKYKDEVVDYLTTEEEIQDMLERIKQSHFTLFNTEKNISYTKIPKPFNTAQIISSMNSKYQYSISQTMSILQKLYEGKELNDDIMGFITYHRTTCNSINLEFSKSIENYIRAEYGDSYFQPNSKLISTASEAHESIRVTDLYKIYELKDKLDAKEFKVYRDIFYNTVASFFKPAAIENITHEFRSENFVVYLKQCRIVFDGVYKLMKSLGIDNKKVNAVTDPEIDMTLFSYDSYFTECVPRYNEGSLVSSLNSMGIGRPSTYQSIVDKLKKYSYIYSQGNKIMISSSGIMLNLFLNNYVSFITDLKVTSDIEEKLDKIAVAALSKEQVITDFISKFLPCYKSVITMNKLDTYLCIENALRSMFDLKCIKCGYDLVMRMSKGKMILCCISSSGCKSFFDVYNYGYLTPALAPVRTFSYKTNIYKKIKSANTKGRKV